MELYSFEPLLNYVEDNIQKKITLEEMSKVAGMSPAHLHRLFKFAYGLTPADYIRKRKLSDSLSAFLQKDFNVLEVALSYGFEHEQSFRRAFKSEFGITPGQYRREMPVLRIMPPIRHFGEKCGNGILFGPEVVLYPKIQLIGIEQDIPFKEASWLAPIAAADFWDNHRHEVQNSLGDEVFYGLTHILPGEPNYSKYLTALAVQNTKHVPAGMKADVFGGYPCVRFHYVGRHHYRELSDQTAGVMYQAIWKFFREDIKILPMLHMERIDTNEYDGEYCLMEWFSPYPENSKKT